MLRSGGASVKPSPEAAAFIDWLNDVVSNTSYSPEERRKKLLQWDKAPAARTAHPREEHLIPLMVVAGAGGGINGKVIYNKWSIASLSLACYSFGDGYQD